MPTARVQEADCSRFVPRLALVFPLRAFFGLYSSCSFLFISIYYLLSSSSCRIFIYFGSSFLFSFFFSSLLGSRSARLCALFRVRRPFGLLFFVDSSRIPPQISVNASTNGGDTTALSIPNPESTCTPNAVLYRPSPRRELTFD